jgi:hypothetical protein
MMSQLHDAAVVWTHNHIEYHRKAGFGRPGALIGGSTNFAARRQRTESDKLRRITGLTVLERDSHLTHGTIAALTVF